MKKVIFIVLVASLFLSSCGMQFEQSMKNLQSDLGGGLNRRIVVENTRTGEEIFVFEGKAYIDDSSIPGMFTVVCTTESGIKKVDFIGRDYGIQSFEK